MCNGGCQRVPRARARCAFAWCYRAAALVLSLPLRRRALWCAPCPPTRVCGAPTPRPPPPTGRCRRWCAGSGRGYFGGGAARSSKAAGALQGRWGAGRRWSRCSLGWMVHRRVVVCGCDPRSPSPATFPLAPHPAPRRTTARCRRSRASMTTLRSRLRASLRMRAC